MIIYKKTMSVSIQPPIVCFALCLFYSYFLLALTLLLRYPEDLSAIILGHIFIVKIGGERKPLSRTYLGICVCMYTCKTKKVHCSKICISPLAECMCLYVWGDLDIHGKFSIIKDGKSPDFIRTMNVFLLVICFFHFFAVCLKLSSCLELWVTRWGELRVREWEWELSWAWNIEVFKSRDQLQTQDLFLRGANFFWVQRVI